MPNQRYIDDPHVSALAGAEILPITQLGVDKYATPSDFKTYALAGYTGDIAITTVGTIISGTWSGAFAPRVAVTATATTLSCSPDGFDEHIISALDSNIVIDIKTSPSPVAGQKFRIRIKDNGTARTLTFDSATVRFQGVANPGTTIMNQTVYFEFEFNPSAVRWDCVLCTDSTAGGNITGSVAATSGLVVLGSGVSDDVTTDAGLTYIGSLLTSTRSTAGGSILAVNNSYNLNGAAPFVVQDGSGFNISFGYTTVASSVYMYAVSAGLYINASYAIGALKYGVHLEGGTGLSVSGKARIGDANFNTGLALEVAGIAAASTGIYAGGITTPTARIHVAAGTASAGTSPIKLTSGTALTTEEDGSIEYHSSHLFFTIGSTRYQLDQQGQLLLAGTNIWSAGNTFSGGLFVNTTGMTIGDVNVALGVGAGTKWGTATSQKQAWYNATPVIQQTTGSAAAIYVSNVGTALTDADTFDGYTLKQIVRILKTYGFLA